MALTPEQIIKKLITEDKSNLTPEFLKDWEKDEIWDDMVQFLHNEQSKLFHVPIRQSDFPNDSNTSLFEYLNQYIDLDSNEEYTEYSFNFILNNLKTLTKEKGDLDTTDKTYPWNESLARALTHYLRYFKMVHDFEGNESNIEYNETGSKVEDTHGSINVQGTTLNSKGGFRINSIMNGNAGYSFEESPWVAPNYNVDAETYDSVRSIDKILEVLMNSEELQYTHSQNMRSKQELNKYIRLLMPKYLRRVEVEDLDRNFWVIGNVLAAISAYLFDPNSPISKEFEKILNELIQLWENVLYLWVLFALLSQKPYISDIHTEVCYIPNEEVRDMFKYDNFDIASPLNMSDAQIMAKLRYLKAEYSDSNLCILPVIRGENYYRNYYHVEKYPGVYFYNRNTDTETFVRFNNFSVDARTTTWGNVSGGIREEGDQYYYGQPMSKIDDIKDIGEHKYYNALRVIPANINVSINNNKKLEITSLEFRVVDAAWKAYNGESRNAATITNNGAINESSSAVNLSINMNSTLPKDVQIRSGVNVQRGLYFGELASSADESEGLTYDVNVKTINLKPLGGTPDPSQYASIDAELLREYAIRVLGPTAGVDSVFTLCIANHNYGYFHQDNIPPFPQSTEDYYDKIGIDQYEWFEDIPMYCGEDPTVPSEVIATSHTSSMQTVAAIYNLNDPDNVIPFNDYVFKPIIGWWLGYARPNYGVTGWSDSRSYIYTRNGEPLNDTNWCIRYVQATGVYTFDDQHILDKTGIAGDKRINASDLSPDHRIGEDYTYEANGTTFVDRAYGMCVAVRINLFYANGDYATRTYYRALEDGVRISDSNFHSSSISDWSVLNNVSVGDFVSKRADLRNWRQVKGETKIDYEENPITGRM